MPSRKGFVIPLIIFIVAILAIGGGFYYKKITTPVGYEWPPEFYNKPATTTVVGGDKDEHGCIGSAGYSWCAVKNKCLRVWEEKCEVMDTPTKPNCNCPAGYVQDEEVCNPQCYYSTPKCLTPSIMCSNQI